MKKFVLLLALLAALFMGAQTGRAAEAHMGSVVGHLRNTSGAYCGFAQCWVHMWKGDGVTTLADGQVSQYTSSCNSVLGGGSYNWGSVTGIGSGNCVSPNGDKFVVQWSCPIGTCTTYYVWIQGRADCPNGGGFKYTNKRQIALTGGVFGHTVQMGDMYANQPAGGCLPQIAVDAFLEPLNY